MKTLFEPDDIQTLASEVSKQLVPELRNLSPRGNTEDQFISKHQAAKILGVKPSWLDNNASKEGITKFKFGGQVRYSRKGIMDWANKQKIL